MSSEESILRTNGYWSTNLSKPNWSEWDRKTRCPLWTAAALACDVEPGNYPHGLPSEYTPDFSLTPVPPQLWELLGLAKSAVGGGTLRVFQKEGTNLMQRDVDLAEFTSWLNRLGHKPPDGYPWTAKELAPGAYQWPWGPHQTKDLAIFAMAADKFWRNYDPTDQSTAPTNAAVIDWLVERNVAKRTAEVMASMLRPEDLRPGPRPK